MSTPMSSLRKAAATLALASVIGLGSAQAPQAFAAAPAPVSSLTSSSCPALVKEGQVSGCVTRLQTLLNARGAKITVDGNFGKATKAAVISFQVGKGLTADGVVGERTKAALEGKAAPAPTKPAPTRPAPSTPAGTTNQKIVSYAKNLVAGQAAPGWKGGAIPYSWGGGHHAKPGPSTGTCDHYTGSIKPCPATRTVGLDCSGFTRYVYSLAYGRDVLGNTTAGEQRQHMTKVSNPQPGDLVFFGPRDSRGNVISTNHVAIYLGNGKIAEAPQTGMNLRIHDLSKKSHLLGYYRLG